MSISCRVCSGKALYVSELSSTNMPKYQNQLCETFEEAVVVERGDYRAYFCTSCGFMFNECFSPLSYEGIAYDNSVVGEKYTTHMDRIVNSFSADLKEGLVLEIGCGPTALFLCKLVDKYRGLKAVGMDPCFSGVEKMYEPLENEGLLSVIKKPFPSLEIENCSVDMVVCRHTIEHLKYPLDLLKEIYRVVKPGGGVYIETPDVGWSLQNGIFYDFYYEHCSLFTQHALERALLVSGFNSPKVATHYGEQYLVGRAKKDAPGLCPSLSPFDFREDAFKTAQEIFSSLKKEAVFRLEKENGRAVLYGAAAAKGVTFCNLLDKDRRLIDHIVDSNPVKAGKYLPGTGHEIKFASQVYTLNSFYSFSPAKFILEGLV